MTEIANIDKIIAEFISLDEKEKIILFHKIEEIFDNSNDAYKDVTIESAFDLWKDRNITKESLKKKKEKRKKAWKQN
jgi:hypothetical protein